MLYQQGIHVFMVNNQGQREVAVMSCKRDGVSKTMQGAKAIFIEAVLALTRTASKSRPSLPRSGRI